MKLGPSFPDSIREGKFKKRRLYGHSFHYPRTKALLLTGFLAGAVLIAGIARLQIFQGSYYRELADGNRIKENVIHAPRGIIYDSKMRPLVHNVPGFRIKGMDGKIKTIEKAEALSLLAQGPRDNLQIATLRQYEEGEVFAHVLGFIGQISEEELKGLKNYKGGDFIGKTGIEKIYESVLKGIDGKELVEVDNLSRKVRVLGVVDVTAGQDVVLSIDKDLSKAAFRAMADVTKGAVVVSSPKTGEILALISKPSFDPNLFTLGEHYKTSTESAYQTVEAVLFDEKDRPLFNRAISGTYPPGSTFKIITAAAGLENEKINEKTEIEDVGVIRIGSFTFPNWYFIQYGKTEGNVDVVRAIARSNDIFFYKVAEFVGLSELGKMGRLFGLSDRLGIDLPAEEAGLFPTDEWKRANVGDQWFLGDTYHLGIGQGYLLTTPLQANAWTAVIANGGTLYQPRLIKNTTNKQIPPIRKDFLKPETVGLIKEGMRQACAPGGTGWPLFEFKVKSEKLKVDEKNFFEARVGTSSAVLDGWVHIPVACKTGTAEFGDPQDRTHAWFSAFAPIESPEIVVTVLVEGGGEGSNVAAPIARKVLEEWFGR